MRHRALLVALAASGLADTPLAGRQEPPPIRPGANVRATTIAGGGLFLRRDDLARVQQTMGQIEGSTGAELRQQNRELWNFLMNNVSQRGTVR